MNHLQRNRLVQDVFFSIQTSRGLKDVVEILRDYGIEIIEVEKFNQSYIKELLKSATDKILLQIASDLEISISNYSSTENDSPFTEKVFISHAEQDKEIVRSFAQFLEILGVKPENMYCTFLEDYNNLKQDNSIQENLEFLDKNVTVFFMLSNNFYKSSDSMLEMGLAFEKTKNQICVAIKPFKLDLIEGFFKPYVGIYIDNKTDYDTLKEIIETKLGIELKETFPKNPMFSIFLNLIQQQLLN